MEKDDESTFALYKDKGSSFDIGDIHNLFCQIIKHYCYQGTMQGS